MPITITAVASDPECLGFEWTVDNIEELAGMVADLLLGKHRHVKKILKELSSLGSDSTSKEIDDLIKTLTDVEDPKAKKQPRRYHRDGWLFQMISWIVIHKRNPNALSAVPHDQPATKGFDSLFVEVSNDAKLKGVVIGEDKATENPRNTVRVKVWPEICSLEAGKRDSALKSEVTAIVERAGYDDEVDEMLKKVLWNDIRKYRVAVAGPCSTHKSLFNGFDIKAPGDIDRRTGEVLKYDDIRDWFDTFTDKVIDKLTDLKAEAYV